ncbi:30S ribosomal protein S20 [Shouchella shacheensis]|uniref:30S ribosomal protein S20 n=1 Tax=Shouchella shacheensis TaxID=1649580 RepID=UPI00073FBED9|nr:30S ribosomal protein S20 [Shouchella shacheensis]
MANIKSAVKRVKTSEARRAQNTSQKSALRSAVRNFEVVANTDSASTEAKQGAFVQAVKKLDKAAGKGLIHKNAASRQKSRLAKKLNGANV